MEWPQDTRPSHEVPVSRIALQTAVRAGAVKLVDDYRAAAGLKLGSVYRARQSKITAPCAFVESISEVADSFVDREYQRAVEVGIRIVWGVYDSGETVDQRDRFVDGFFVYVAEHRNAFDGNADCIYRGSSDDPDWSPSWIPNDQSVYFSTLVTLEGRAST